MLISDILLAILYVMEAFLIAICFLVGNLYLFNKTSDTIALFRRKQRLLKKEEDDIELFIHDLYVWAKRNSNLVNQV